MGTRVRSRIPRLSEAGGRDEGEIAAFSAGVGGPGAVGGPATGGPDAIGGVRGAGGMALRLAVVGDSAAAGVGAPTHDEALGGQLAAALAGLTGRTVSWRVVARSGATARTVRRDLLERLTDPHTRWRPDLVVLVVGVNDATRLRPPPAFGRDVASLVAAVRARLGEPTPILLAGLPPVDRFPALPPPVRRVLGAYARRLDRRLGRVAAAGEGVYHLPVGALPVYRDDLFAADGFHPGPVGYRVWARLLAAQAATVLETTAA